MSSSRRICLALVLLLSATAVRAQTTLCVESTQGLFAAFTQIPRSTGEVELRLRSGTYSIGAGLHLELGRPAGPRGRLTLRGGYGAGCASRSDDPAATVLSSDRQGLIRIEIGDEPLLIENLSSEGVDWEVDDHDFYNRDYGMCSRAGQTVVLRRLRLLQTHVALRLACQDSRLENSLVVARADPPGGYAVEHTVVNPHIVTPEGFGAMSLVFATVRGGGVRYRGCCWTDIAAGVVTVVNSVIEASTVELVVHGDVDARNSRFDSSAFTGGTVINHHDILTQPARLQADGRPQSDSPLINAGTRFASGGLPSVDLAGAPRLVGTAPDIGAFESSADNALYLDVTSTAASGPGTLAAAVQAANAFNGRQIVRFALSGACPRIITLAAPLQISDALEIRGQTQTGSVANSLVGGFNGQPCVVLAAGAGVSDAIDFSSSEAEDALDLSQLAFAGFVSDAVTIRSGRGHRLAGLRFGGSTHGLALAPVGTALRITGSAGAAQIGGELAAERNLFGQASIALSLAGSGGNSVLGNAIGDAGFLPLPNQIGLSLLSPYNRVQDNLIAHSSLAGLLLSSESAHRNRVSGNQVIGGSGASSAGVQIMGAAHRNRIGPDNRIAHGDGDGIGVLSGSFNDLGGNLIYDNSGLGIDLGTDGPDANDNDPLFDGNSSANRGQNHPVLSLARRRVASPFVFVDIKGSLRSTRGSYRIELYRSDRCHASGYGEGRELLDSMRLELDCAFVGPDNQCNRSFSRTLLGGGLALGDAVTAIAISAGNHTSEFSACISVGSEIIDLPALFADGFE